MRSPLLGCLAACPSAPLESLTLIRSFSNKYAQHLVRSLPEQAFTPAPKGVAFGKKASPMACRTTPPLAVVKAHARVSQQPAQPASSSHKPRVLRAHDAGPLLDSKYFTQRNEDFSQNILRVGANSILVKPTAGGEFILEPAQASQLTTKPQTRQAHALGKGMQLIKLAPDDPLQKQVVKDKEQSALAVQKSGLAYDFETVAHLKFWDQLPLIPSNGKLHYLPTSVVNARSIAAGRAPEWEGPFVVLTVVPAGARLIQISTDALPVMPIGTSSKDFDSQTFLMSRALRDGKQAPLGGYFLVCAPTSAGQAAFYAAILNVWKEACTHFSIVEVTEPIPMLFGLIGKQDDYYIVNPHSGQLHPITLRGGVLQANPVDVADAVTKLRPLDLHQVFTTQDKEVIQDVLDSRHPGGAVVANLLRRAHLQDLFSGLA